MLVYQRVFLRQSNPYWCVLRREFSGMIHSNY